MEINESKFLKEYPNILSVLLFDNTTKKNITWSTDNYKGYGPGYYEKDFIKAELIFGKSNCIIKPRVEKSKREQRKRSRDMAEVFTPSWVCNKQNNLVDENWFGYKNPFNREDGNSWIVNEKIEFKNGKNWKDYVEDIRLEVACGEAPYLVSRYDTVTGEYISINNRIGMLDRKLRVVNENVSNDLEWYEYLVKAFKSIYGFDYQGDNLFLARENLLFTFVEYYFDRYNELPSEDKLVEVATIISWNVWQMDGIKLVVPNSCHEESYVQASLFNDVKPTFCEGCQNGNAKDYNGTKCLIMDWDNNRKVKFVDLM